MKKLVLFITLFLFASMAHAAQQTIVHVPGGVSDNSTNAAANANFTELYAAGKIVTSAAPAAGAANTTSVTITVTDKNGTAVSAIHNLECWVSDDADGNGLTATSASGALTASTGTILTALTAKKHVIANTSAAGVLVLALVDSAKTQGERFCCKNPTTGQIVVGAATVTASYGS